MQPASRRRRGDETGGTGGLFTAARGGAWSAWLPVAAGAAAVALVGRPRRAAPRHTAPTWQFELATPLQLRSRPLLDHLHDQAAHLCRPGSG